MAMLQAIARIYRYGQTHATFVYRLLYKGTAEHRVYRRNVDKEGLFMRVVDKQTVKGELTHLQGLSLVVTDLSYMKCISLAVQCGLSGGETSAQ